MLMVVKLLFQIILALLVSFTGLLALEPITTDDQLTMTSYLETLNSLLLLATARLQSKKHSADGQKTKKGYVSIKDAFTRRTNQS